MKTVRYWQHGWTHAEPIRKGRKWFVVRDLHLSRRRSKDGTTTYLRRIRRVKADTVQPGLWDAK